MAISFDAKGDVRILRVNNVCSDEDQRECQQPFHIRLRPQGRIAEASEVINKYRSEVSNRRWVPTWHSGNVPRRNQALGEIRIRWQTDDEPSEAEVKVNPSSDAEKNSNGPVH